MVDGLAGAVLSTGVALGLVWLAGSVVLQAPQAHGLRDDIQRSSILRALNDVLPPSGPILNALARFDPFPRIDGPARRPARAAGGDRARPRRAPRGPRRGQDPGDGLRPGGGGLGLGRPRRARGDQRARRRRPAATRRSSSAGAGRGLPAHAVVFDPHDDIAILRVEGLSGRALPLAADPRSGASGAILGFPQNGPYDVRAGAPGLDARGDHAGRLRARAGPALDRHAARHACARATRAARGRRARARAWPPSSPRRAAAPPGGYGVPNAVVARDLRSGSPAARCPPGRAPAELPCGVHGQDPRHRREAVRGPGPRPRAARSVREAHRCGGQDRALAGGPRARHHLGRRPPRPARRARRVRRQVQEVADGRPADRPARASSSSCATSAPRSR